MSYKKYIKRGGKVYGPYIYESKRIGGKVVSRYICKHEPKPKIHLRQNEKNNRRVIFSIIVVLILANLFMLLYNSNFFENPLTGRSVIELSPIYKINETINGKFNLVIQQGELIPSDSLLKLELNNQSSEIPLSQLLSLQQNSGSYYIKDSSLTGEGQGYGIFGKKKIYPTISFRFLIKSEEQVEQPAEIPVEMPTETPAETLLETPTEIPTEQPIETPSETPIETPAENPVEVPQEQPAETPAETPVETPAPAPTAETTTPAETPSAAPSEPVFSITGEAVFKIEKEVDGEVSFEKTFEYQLSDGEEIEIIEGGIYCGNKSLSSNELNIEQSGNLLKITTSYYEEVEGFGADYTGDGGESLEVDLEQFGILAEEGILKASLVYENQTLIETVSTIKVEGEEESEEEEIVNESRIANETEIIELNLTETNITLIENLTNETIITNVTSIVGNLSETTIQYSAVVGKPVRWKKIVSSSEETNMTIQLPKEAVNISVVKIENGGSEEFSGFSITGNAIKNLFGKLTGLIVEENFTREINFSIIEPSDTEEQSIIEIIEINNETNLSRVGGADNLSEPLNETEEEQQETTESENIVIELNESATEVEVEYYTEAPQASEENTSFGKSIVISGPDSLHYENVLAYALLPFEVSSEKSIKLDWIANIINGNETLIIRQEANFSAYDSDNNSKFDYIEWVVPHLSNQSYELSISILNVYSHPSLYGNWSVEFITSGASNLTITATLDENYSTNATRWTNYSDDSDLYDLKFLEIYCGNLSLNYSWIGENCSEADCSILISNYSCDETGIEISEVLTPEKHVLKFEFGDEEAYAYNDVPGAYSPLNTSLIVVGDLTNTITHYLLWNGSAYSAQQNMTDITGTAHPYILEMAASPVYGKEEAAMVMTTSGAFVNTSIWRGGSWVYGSQFKNKTDIGTTYRYDSAKVGYFNDTGILAVSSTAGETASVDARSRFVYRIYNGNSWGGDLLPSSDISVDQYLRNQELSCFLANNECAVISHGTISGQTYGGTYMQIFNGTAFNSAYDKILNGGTLVTYNQSRGIYRSLDVEYTINGDALAVWATLDYNINYIIWNGTSKTYKPTTTAPPQVAFDGGYYITTIELATNPKNASEAALICETLNEDIFASYFNGTGWTAPQTLTLVSPVSANYRNVDVGYDKDGTAMIVWGNTTNVYSMTWDGATWSNLKPTVDTAANVQDILLVSDPYSNERILMTSDANNDVFSQIWNGTNWTDNNGVSQLKTLDISSQKYFYDFYAVYFTKALAPSLVSLISPVNGYSTASSALAFQCNATSIVPLTNISLFHNFTGTWQLNKTNSASGTFSSTSFDVSGINSGGFIWNCYACSASGNCTFAAANFSMSVLGNVPPEITIVSPLNSTYATGTIRFNVSTNENTSWCGFSLDNAANLTMQRFNESYFNYTKVGVADGGHNVTFSCNDTSNLASITALRWFGIDTTPPVITIVSPLNLTYNSQLVDSNVSTNENTSWCGFSLNDAANTTMNKFNESYFYYTNSLALGTGYNITFSCNDTFNNVATTALRWFGVNDSYLSYCTELNITNKVYTLANSVNSSKTCFNITANNVTLDCQGFEINYSAAGLLGYGVYAQGSNGSTIKNCFVKEGSATTGNKHGLYVYSSRNTSVINNTVRTYGGSDAINFNTKSISGTISNNTLITYGSSANGLFLYDRCANITISGNIINTTNSGHGIEISTDSDGVNVTNNFINTSGGSNSNGIWVYDSSFVLVYNNSINTSGANSLYLYYSYYGNFSNNWIKQSISVKQSDHNYIVGNKVFNSMDSTHGIYCSYGQSNNTIIFNTISCTGSGSNGMRFYGAVVSSDIGHNFINVSGATSYGLSLSTGTIEGMEFFNNTIYTLGASTEGGIYIDDGIFDNNFTNMTVNTSGVGIYFDAASSARNAFDNVKIYTNNSNAYGIYVSTSGHNFTMKNSVVSAYYSNTADLNITNAVKNGIWNFTNTSINLLDKFWANANGTLQFNWYLDVYSNYSNSSNAVGVNATGWDINYPSGFVFSELTGNNGRITTKTVPEYIQNRTIVTYFNNYTVNASLSGFSEQKQSVNMSTNRDLNFEFAISANTAPETTEPTVSPASAYTDQDITCTFTVTDVNAGDALTANTTWYRDGVVNLTYLLSVETGVENNVVLNAANTTKGENWICGVMPNDDAPEFGAWKNSTNATIINKPPTISILSPDDNTQTTDRTPEFNYSGSDADLDGLTYEVNISCYDGCSADNRMVTGLNGNYTVVDYLLYLIDNDYNYNWSVRSYDSSNYSAWSTARVINISSLVVLALPTPYNFTYFGVVNISETKNTTTDDPAPLKLQNDGNCLLNVSLNASELFIRADHPSDNFMYKIDNVSGEEGSFNWGQSNTTWKQFPALTGLTVAVTALNWTDATDSAEVDLLVIVPSDEPDGNRSSTVNFMASLDE